MADRLQKVLAAAGIASRRASEELIVAGRVTVNGEVATIGDRVDAATDVVEVDGERVIVDTTRRYLMLNKPQGVVSTTSDPEGRPTVMDLINLDERLYPVGRLDQDTEGLLLLTNDGDLAHRLLHPSFGVERTYLALVPGPVRREPLRRLSEGVELEDGIARPKRVRVAEEHRGKALIEVVMTEGRKREVRRMLAEVGMPVERLARVSFGGVELGDLRQGKWRFLNRPEVARLHAVVGSPVPDDVSEEATSWSSEDRSGDRNDDRTEGGRLEGEFE
jgi:23S rRNA pseudouridine2605 synthase